MTRNTDSIGSQPQEVNPTPRYSQLAPISQITLFDLMYPEFLADPITLRVRPRLPFGPQRFSYRQLVNAQKNGLLFSFINPRAWELP